MKPTEILRNEHEAILLMLSILERVADKLDAKEFVKVSHLEKILEFIKVFADRCHHAKEEKGLFKALIDSGFPKEGGPIEVMLSEHDQGRSYVKGLSSGIVKYKTGEPTASSLIADNARNYVGLLRDHIDKENDILYPIADMHIPEEKQKSLVKEFDRIEKEEVGAGKHDEFHRLLGNLEKTYLS